MPAETVRAADYFYVMVPDKPGEGARVLGELKRAGVNPGGVLGLSRAAAALSSDLVPTDPAAFKALAKEKKWKVKGPKRTFLIDGDDRLGACADVLARLAAAKINVTAMDAVAPPGGGRYAAILWVKARDVKKAAAVLGAT